MVGQEEFGVWRYERRAGRVTGGAGPNERPAWLDKQRSWRDERWPGPDRDERQSGGGDERRVERGEGRAAGGAG